MTCQYFGLLEFVNINAYAKFIKVLHMVQKIGPVSLFPNLDLGKASTDDKCHLPGNPFVLILSKSMGMQNFIEIFLMVEELWSIFANWRTLFAS